MRVERESHVPEDFRLKKNNPRYDELSRSRQDFRYIAPRHLHEHNPKTRIRGVYTCALYSYQV